ncbi:isochorismatase family protein [Amycolatopsis mongoliensis]|uniref:Isochorismatase family protein n=1 Tax=Amycolatopsis mongoliensis TaxID=715475 RepID=A0A9Y2JNF0_9PSEU|nr:isochorismatase family protein [Amycolatopsis sp. 4-36]WIY01238.1 isochorismatase family protein [Amycolatopsis sp. 4-36]
MSTSDPFDGTLAGGSRPALVLIDLMRAYFTEGSPLLLPSRDCLGSAARVLAAARRHGIPVVHTRVAYGADGVDGGLFLRKVPALRMLQDGGGPLGEFMPEVAPAEGEQVVVKQYPSAFFGTPLASSLRARGVDTVVIGGVSTSGCVRASALDALQHGFVPLVVREAVGDRTPETQEANLFDIQAKCGEVVGEATALAYLAEGR